MRSLPCETVGPERQSTTVTCLPTDEKKVNSLSCFPRRKPRTSKFKVDEARIKAEFWGLVVLLPVTLLHNPAHSDFQGQGGTLLRTYAACKQQKHRCVMRRESSNTRQGTLSTTKHISRCAPTHLAYSRCTTPGAQGMII